MEPITILVGALVAGAAAGVTKVAGSALPDLYQGLKSLILDRHREKAPAIESAIQVLEADPADQAARNSVESQVLKAEIMTDQEIIDEAKRLLAVAEEEGAIERAEGGKMIQITNTGSGVVVVGDRNVVASHGSIAIGGNIGGNVSRDS